MGLIPLGQFIREGGTFSTLIYVLSETVIPVVFGLWCARWIYKILIDIGNGGER
ncbi:MAG: hypothetical protein ACI4KA_00135 [Oscillospiraceae bacterium]